MIRRRKRDFGEPIVPCTLKTVSAPMGVAQRELYEKWLSKSTFASFFTWKYPDHALVAKRPDRAVRRGVWPAHQARVRHHRPGGRDRPRLARPGRT